LISAHSATSRAIPCVPSPGTRLKRFWRRSNKTPWPLKRVSDAFFRTDDLTAIELNLPVPRYEYDDQNAFHPVVDCPLSLEWWLCSCRRIQKQDHYNFTHDLSS